MNESIQANNRLVIESVYLLANLILDNVVTISDSLEDKPSTIDGLNEYHDRNAFILTKIIDNRLNKKVENV